MSVNIKMGSNNNLITNSSYTKFPVVTMDIILSWNIHIDLLMKKFSISCYKISIAKPHMSACWLEMIYHPFFHFAISYGITLWGNL